MSIIIGGKEYRTLADKLYVNGGLLKEAYVNGSKVYPACGRYVVRTQTVMPIDFSRLDPWSSTCEVKQGYVASSSDLACALESYYGQPGLMSDISYECYTSGDDIDQIAELVVDAVFTANETSGRDYYNFFGFGFNDAQPRTAADLTVSTNIWWRGPDGMVMTIAGDTDGWKVTDNPQSGVIVSIGEGPRAYIIEPNGFEPSYRSHYIGAVKFENFNTYNKDLIVDRMGFGDGHYVDVSINRGGINTGFSFNAKRVVAWFHGGNFLKWPVYFLTRPWWVANGTREKLQPKRYGETDRVVYSNATGLNIGEPPPIWACDPRIPIPNDV